MTPLQQLQNKKVTKLTKWDVLHAPWCSFSISLNAGGPLFNRCDCGALPKKKKETPQLSLFV